MAASLLGIYAVVGYWYFRQVLDLCDNATPSETILNSILGLLFGPVFVGVALVLRIVEDMRDAIKRGFLAGNY